LSPHALVGIHSVHGPIAQSGSHSSAYGADLDTNTRLHAAAIRRYVTYGIIAALILGMAVFQFITARQQEFDGVRINLAGRQRMLSQKILSGILLYDDGRETRSAVEKNIAVFDSALRALIDGGTAPLDLAGDTVRTLRPIDNTSIRTQMLRVMETWRPFRDRCEEFIERRDRAALQYLIANNFALLDQIDRTAYLLQVESERKNSIITGVLAAEIALIFLLFGLILSRYILRLRNVEAHIRDLEKLLPICSACKKIRIDDAHPENMRSWISIEKYLHESKINLTHGICPECAARLYPDLSPYKK